MKFVIRLKPSSDGVYFIVVQSARSSYTSPILEKLGTVTMRDGASYIEVSLKNLGVWLRAGAAFSNKRLFFTIANFYERA